MLGTYEYHEASTSGSPQNSRMMPRYIGWRTYPYKPSRTTTCLRFFWMRCIADGEIGVPGGSVPDDCAAKDARDPPYRLRPWRDHRPAKAAAVLCHDHHQHEQQDGVEAHHDSIHRAPLCPGAGFARRSIAGSQRARRHVSVMYGQLEHGKKSPCLWPRDPARDPEPCRDVTRPRPPIYYRMRGTHGDRPGVESGDEVFDLGDYISRLTRPPAGPILSSPSRLRTRYDIGPLAKYNTLPGEQARSAHARA